jgi:hypothetical protein
MSGRQFGFLGIKGTVGGAALGLDPAPNTTPPAASRTARASTLESQQIVVFADQACLVNVWLLEEKTGRWFELADSVSVTPATPGSVAVFANAEMFVQLAANAGGAGFLGFAFMGLGGDLV